MAYKSLIIKFWWQYSLIIGCYSGGSIVDLFRFLWQTKLIYYYILVFCGSIVYLLFYSSGRIVYLLLYSGGSIVYLLVYSSGQNSIFIIIFCSIVDYFSLVTLFIFWWQYS